MRKNFQGGTPEAIHCFDAPLSTGFPSILDCGLHDIFRSFFIVPKCSALQVYLIAVHCKCIELQCTASVSNCSALQVYRIAVHCKCIELQCTASVSNCSVLQVVRTTVKHQFLRRGMISELDEHYEKIFSRRDTRGLSRYDVPDKLF